MNVVYLISLNPQGAHGGGSGMACYSHNALWVTLKSNWEWYLCEVFKCKYVPLETLVLSADLLNQMKYSCPW